MIDYYSSLASALSHEDTHENLFLLLALQAEQLPPATPCKSSAVIFKSHILVITVMMLLKTLKN